MKIVFISNYINHHQIPFCEELIKLLGPEGDFAFIQTEKTEEERLRMGWSGSDVPEYVLRSYENEEAHELCFKKVMEADIALIGWTTDISLFIPRLKKGALSFRISERLYKKSRLYAVNPRGLIAKYKEHTAFNRSPLYLLCAGAYVAGDFGIFHSYPGKKYRWGYFPEFIEYPEDELFVGKPSQGEPVRLLWAGRFIDWKHAENALLTAEALKDAGVDFHMDIIGTGELEASLKEMAAEKGLDERVSFTGPMPPDKVRRFMERADIFISTSDRQEGWGAVINEAMNSGCACIAPIDAGAVPYLINNGVNGFSYRSSDTAALADLSIKAAGDAGLRRTLGLNAYKTIRDTWNAKTAAERLMELSHLLMEGWGIEEGKAGMPTRKCTGSVKPEWQDGPCSLEK